MNILKLYLLIFLQKTLILKYETIDKHEKIRRRKKQVLLLSSGIFIISASVISRRLAIALYPVPKPQAVLGLEGI